MVLVMPTAFLTSWSFVFRASVGVAIRVCPRQIVGDKSYWDTFGDGGDDDGDGSGGGDDEDVSPTLWGCDKRMLMQIDIARGSYVFELMRTIVEDEDHLYSCMPFKQKMRQNECIVDKASGEDFIFSTTKGVLS